MEENNSGNIGIMGVLLIVFIVLKMCGLIDWSWWWVLSPVWITLGLAAICFVVRLLVKMCRNRDKVATSAKVVYCKNCLFAEYDADGRQLCVMTNRFVASNDFCSKGVRKG